MWFYSQEVLLMDHLMVLHLLPGPFLFNLNKCLGIMKNHVKLVTCLKCHDGILPQKY